MLVMNKKDMAAGILAALLTRKRFATRDMFDMWFFLKNHWEINAELLRAKTGMSLSVVPKKAQEQIKSVKPTELLSGLGELFDVNKKPGQKKINRGAHVPIPPVSANA